MLVGGWLIQGKVVAIAERRKTCSVIRHISVYVHYLNNIIASHRTSYEIVWSLPLYCKHEADGSSSWYLRTYELIIETRNDKMGCVRYRLPSSIFFSSKASRRGHGTRHITLATILTFFPSTCQNMIHNHANVIHMIERQLLRVQSLSRRHGKWFCGMALVRYCCDRRINHDLFLTSCAKTAFSKYIRMR